MPNPPASTLGSMSWIVTVGAIVLVLFVVPAFRKGLFDLFRGKTGTEAIAEDIDDAENDGEVVEETPYDHSAGLPLDEMLNLFKDKILEKEEAKNA